MLGKGLFRVRISHHQKIQWSRILKHQSFSSHLWTNQQQRAFHDGNLCSFSLGMEYAWVKTVWLVVLNMLRGTVWFYMSMWLVYTYSNLTNMFRFETYFDSNNHMCICFLKWGNPIIIPKFQPTFHHFHQPRSWGSQVTPVPQLSGTPLSVMTVTFGSSRIRWQRIGTGTDHLLLLVYSKVGDNYQIHGVK